MIGNDYMRLVPVLRFGKEQMIQSDIRHLRFKGSDREVLVAAQGPNRVNRDGFRYIGDDVQRSILEFGAEDSTKTQFVFIRCVKG